MRPQNYKERALNIFLRVGIFGNKLFELSESWVQPFAEVKR